MIKTLLRTLAYLITSLAFCLAFIDGLRSIDKGEPTLTSLKSFASFVGFQLPDGAAQALQNLLNAPASLTLFAIGALIMLLGRKRRLIMPELRTK